LKEEEEKVRRRKEEEEEGRRKGDSHQIQGHWAICGLWFAAPFLWSGAYLVGRGRDIHEFFPIRLLLSNLVAVTFSSFFFFSSSDYHAESGRPRPLPGGT
jgi:hypothetical protein